MLRILTGRTSPRQILSVPQDFRFSSFFLVPCLFSSFLVSGKECICWRLCLRFDRISGVAEKSALQNHKFQHNIAIITSRPAGYKRDFFRTEEFTHYELLAFDNDKVEEFVNRWYDSRCQDKAEAERRKESLRKALNNNERIKLLGRNPLLLTIIALIHRYQAVLPKERHKLYDKAVETLITEINCLDNLNPCRDAI